MIPSRVKEWSANHVLSMATRSCYCSFMAKEKLRIIEAEKLETVQREESMMWGKIVFVTGAKNQMRLREKNIVIVGHFAARKQGIRNLKKGYAITWTIKEYGCTVTIEMCQLKALAVTKELGITVSNLHYVSVKKRLASECQRLLPGIGTAWQRPTMLSTRTSC